MPGLFSGTSAKLDNRRTASGPESPLPEDDEIMDNKLSYRRTLMRREDEVSSDRSIVGVSSLGASYKDLGTSYFLRAIPDMEEAMPTLRLMLVDESVNFTNNSQARSLMSLSTVASYPILNFNATTRVTTLLTGSI
mmetsp:Transcript_19367/g.34842  ORF Transcript_19367/g.34842 Transcript_19367/m.34842 type:complete len:136 (-) Transcript_19367:106-513(-)|eukprot:CAMPEP_0201636230 /NCGR_PEP_ID=MMETSP0493-20130528/8468_1 /ASSEMBLY_ACC=CAM_ASM_000838 /TAXON_ID=420259 /ORGANISM="Thalassiosira gravida, Strain GMp14c1" /LENGTH=135 /DNA_ID=CAMNT_0048108295 /DNA_START=329 /DNA_END=736 /DNA_ORIENTATION=-